MGDNDVPVAEPSDQCEQLQPGDSLMDRGVEDALDEGWVAPEKWSSAMRHHKTAEEALHRDSLEERMAQEEPDVSVEGEVNDWRDEADRQVGDRRAGRLVDANHGYGGADTESEAIGEDVGIDGGAATAEEAAMHIIDDEDNPDSD